MKVITYGERKKEAVLLIPPGGLDERCFSRALPYMQAYYVIVPTLNGSVLGEASTLTDRKTEARAILEHLQGLGISELRLMAGISYGATVALEALTSRKVRIHRTVLDGGAFLPYGWLMKACNLLGTNLYLSRIKKHPDRPSIYSSLGEEIDRAGKEIFGQMSKESVKNLILDSMAGTKVVPGGVTKEDHLLVTYGEKDGYRGGIKWFHKSGYPFEEKIIKGYGHCRYFAEHPKEYVRDLFQL